MPFKSKAQMRFLYAKKPGVAKEFSDKTSHMKLKRLPEKVGAKKASHEASELIRRKRKVR